MTEQAPYKYTDTTGNQYEELYDLSTEKTVEAIYRECYGDTGNPFVEALPPAKDVEEVFKAYSRAIFVPTQKELASMSLYDRVTSLKELKRYRVPLPFHPALEMEFHRALSASYGHRVRKENRTVNVNATIGNETVSYHGKTMIRNMSEVPEGFTLLGISGCGKSTAINMLLEHYPQVIIHNKGTWKETIQVTYLHVNCQPNSNFSTLYAAIGRELDNALGNLTPVYEEEVNKRTRLGVKKDYIRSLIEIFSIGILILDEIELIDLSSTKENSIETLLTLTNETGIALAAVGTIDAYESLFKKRRTARRMGVLIKASKYCENKTQFSRVAKVLSFYQWREKKIEYTQDMIDMLYKCSNGTISDLVGIYSQIEKNYIMGSEKGEVTPKYIEKVANEYYEGLQRINEKERNPVLADSRALTDDEVRAMNDFLANSEMDELHRKYEEVMSRQDLADYYQLEASVVIDVTRLYPKYRRSSIESTFRKIMEKETDSIIPLADAVAKTVAFLEMKEQKKIEKEQVKKRNLLTADDMRRTLLGDEKAG